MLYKWTAGGSSYGIGTGGRFGGGCCVLGPTYPYNGSVSKTLDAQATWYVGAAFLTPSGTLIALLDGGSSQISVATVTGGHLAVYRGATLLATGATVLSSGVWYYVELGATINSSTGSYTLKINGVTELTASGVNTQSTGNASANTIQIGSMSNSAKVDDLYVCDGQGSVNNTFLGDVRVQALLPASDGGETQWTPSAGTTHYSLVDEVPPDGDTSYVYSSTAGQVDVYGMSAIAASTGTVKGVQWLAYARKDDAGTRTIAPLIRISSTDYAGSDQNIGTSYTYYLQVYEEDPSTSAAWTIAGVNAAEMGIKEVA